MKRLCLVTILVLAVPSPVPAQRSTVEDGDSTALWIKRSAFNQSTGAAGDVVWERLGPHPTAADCATWKERAKADVEFTFVKDRIAYADRGDGWDVVDGQLTREYRVYCFPAGSDPRK